MTPGKTEFLNLVESLEKRVLVEPRYRGEPRERKAFAQARAEEDRLPAALGGGRDARLDRALEVHWQLQIVEHLRDR